MEEERSDLGLPIWLQFASDAKESKLRQSMLAQALAVQESELGLKKLLDDTMVTSRGYNVLKHRWTDAQVRSFIFVRDAFCVFFSSSFFFFFVCLCHSSFIHG
jgi:hypothetical protein